MVAHRKKLFLLLLSMQQTDQRVVLRHSPVQEMRDHNPQDMQVHQAAEARLQVFGR